MFTVKIESNTTKAVYFAHSVKIEDEIDGTKSIVIDTGYASSSSSERYADFSISTDTDVWVMNESGKTVAHYHVVIVKK